MLLGKHYVNLPVSISALAKYVTGACSRTECIVAATVMATKQVQTPRQYVGMLDWPGATSRELHSKQLSVGKASLGRQESRIRARRGYGHAMVAECAGWD